MGHRIRVVQIWLVAFFVFGIELKSQASEVNCLNCLAVVELPCDNSESFMNFLSRYQSFPFQSEVFSRSGLTHGEEYQVPVFYETCKVLVGTTEVAAAERNLTSFDIAKIVLGFYKLNPEWGFLAISAEYFPIQKNVGSVGH